MKHVTKHITTFVVECKLSLEISCSDESLGGGNEWDKSMVIEEKVIMVRRCQLISWFSVHINLCEGWGRAMILERVGKAEIDRHKKVSVREIKGYWEFKKQKEVESKLK